MRDGAVLRTMRVIAKQECRHLLRSSMTYVWLSVSLAIANLVMGTYLDAIRLMGVGVYSDLHTYPFALSGFLLGAFLSLWASTTIAREREGGTLQVLFWTPASEVGFLVGKVLGGALGAGLFSAVLVAFLILSAWFTGIASPHRLPPAILALLLFSTTMTALGLFVSALAVRVRTAAVILAALIILLPGIEGTAAILGKLPPEQLSRPLLLLRDGLIVLSKVLGIVSPLQRFGDCMEAVRVGSGGMYLQSLASSLALLIAFVGLGVLCLRVRGVRQ